MIPVYSLVVFLTVGGFLFIFHFRATVRDHNQGLGLEQPDALDNNDDEYDAYRKRMMLAYRFRPNPLVSHVNSFIPVVLE